MIVKKFERHDQHENVEFLLERTRDERAFYLRFSDKSLEEEFCTSIDLLISNGAKLKKQFAFGTYAILDLEKTSYEGEWNAWDIIMHKYFALSKEIYVA